MTRREEKVEDTEKVLHLTDRELVRAEKKHILD